MAAILVLTVVDGATGSTATAAYAATVAESVAYYGSTFLRDWLSPHFGDTHTRSWGASNPLRVMRHLLQEFGGAELLDLFVLRPLCLGTGLELVGGAAGALGGKIAADLAFYAQVLPMYERRRRIEVRW